MENQSAPVIVRSVADNTGKSLSLVSYEDYPSLGLNLVLFFHQDIAEYVNASIETNPLDGKCDQRIRLNVQPLEVIYHAVSVYVLFWNCFMCLNFSGLCNQ